MARVFDERCAAMVLAGLLATGCSDSQLKLPPTTSALGSDAPSAPKSDDPPVEVYARVARGALKCWFGPEGSLKQTHVFHAKADPPSSGGAAEISVHTRETGSSHASGGTVVEVQNYRFPDSQSKLMIGDVSRWVGGEAGCSIVGTGGWQAGSTTTTAAPQAPVEVSRKR